MKANKQLKTAFKLKKPDIGIFQIRNKMNDKIFVGSSVNLEAVWNRMKAELKFGSHRNKQLQDDWKGFGEDNFSFEILYKIDQNDEEKVDYTKEVKKLEELFMEELQPFGEKGYNTFKV